MTTQALAGWAALAVALMLTLSNVSDVIADLKNWHDASTPQFVAAILKQVATTALAALGGKILPTKGS